MWSRMVPAALLAIVVGLVLGCVPWLNQHLHWTLWYVVPISGLLFGCAVAAIEFGYSFKVNQKISGGAMAILVSAAVVGYISVDYGIYRTTTITVKDHEEIPDGEYNLSGLISFWQYMKLNLGVVAAETEDGGTIKIGAMISYIVDLLGTALGATGVLLMCRDTYPFCVPCNRYKQQEQIYNIMLKLDEQKIEEIFGHLGKLIEEGIYASVVGYCQQLAQNYTDPKGKVKICIDQRYCPGCMEADILGTVHRKSCGEWNEIDNLKLDFTSQPGEHVAFENG